MSGKWRGIGRAFLWVISPLSVLTWLDLSISLIPDDERRSWRYASRRSRKAWWIVMLTGEVTAALLRCGPAPTWITIPFLLIALGGTFVCLILGVFLLIGRISPARLSVFAMYWCSFTIVYWVTAIALRLALGSAN